MSSRALIPPPASGVKFSNPDKILFPKAEFIKGEMIRYYVEAAPFILPHFAPDWVKIFAVPRQHHEGTINYILANDARTFA